MRAPAPPWRVEGRFLAQVCRRKSDLRHRPVHLRRNIGLFPQQTAEAGRRPSAHLCRSRVHTDRSYYRPLGAIQGRFPVCQRRYSCNYPCSSSSKSAFLQDQTFFLKTIGTVNPAEMEQKLILNLKDRQTDSAFILTVNDLSGRWFQKTPAELTLEQKTRLIPYLYRCYRTTVPQLARCLQESPETIERIIRK